MKQTQTKTLLDIAFEEKQAAINTNFLKEWKPFEKLNKQVESAILNYFRRNICIYQPTHDPKSKQPFVMVSSFTRINTFLGLAYTSTGAFAGLWVCNGGYLFPPKNETHNFIGFAINEIGQVIGIADDENENSIYIIL
jgi:hypothetical protein